MKHLVKFLTVVEIEVEAETHAAAEAAQEKLDAFREATLPSENYGVTPYRATPDDLSDDLLSARLCLYFRPNRADNDRGTRDRGLHRVAEGLEILQRLARSGAVVRWRFTSESAVAVS